MFHVLDPGNVQYVFLKRVTSAVDMETMLRLLMHAINVVTTSVANYIDIFIN